MTGCQRVLEIDAYEEEEPPPLSASWTRRPPTADDDRAGERSLHIQSPWGVVKPGNIGQHPTTTASRPFTPSVAPVLEAGPRFGLGAAFAASVPGREARRSMP